MNDPPRPSISDSSSPAPLRLAPSTLGEILDRTIQLYRNRFLLYLGISLIPTAVVVIPPCVIFCLVLWVGPVAPESSTPAVVGVVGIILLAFIGSLALPILIAVAALAAAAMPYAVSRDYLGEKTTIREAYKAVWHHGWRYSWLLILEGLIIFAAPIAAWTFLVVFTAGAAAFAHLSGFGGGALFGLAAFLVFIALAVYFFWMLLRLSLAFPACVVEQISATRALQRTSTLSKGTKGRIFLLYLLVGVLNWILSIGITVPLTIVIALIPGASDPKNASTLGLVLLFVIYGAGFVIQALTYPLYGIALTLFYYDQRIRQEGFDIEWMMQRAGMLDRTVSQGFIPGTNTGESTGALQAAEKVNTEGGGGFNPRINPTESIPALAAEGSFSLISPEISSSSAASLAPEESSSQDSIPIADSSPAQSPPPQPALPPVPPSTEPPPPEKGEPI